MILVGIDVGYKNVGLVMAECIKEKIDVKYFKRVDITKIKCPLNCKLHHTNEVSDLVAHFVQHYKHIFEQADQIIVERQPPGGLTSVEALFHYIFREKVRLISPNSMHKHFGIGHLDYENRKLRTECIASKYIDMSGMTRKHDVADALCMIIFQNYLNKDLFKKEIEKNPFEYYRFN